MRSLSLKNIRSFQLLSTALLVPSVALYSNIQLINENDDRSNNNSNDDSRRVQQKNVQQHILCQSAKTKKDKTTYTNSISNEQKSINDDLYDVEKSDRLDPLKFLNDLIFDKQQQEEQQQQQQEKLSQVQGKSILNINKDNDNSKDDIFSFASMTETFTALLTGEVSDKAFKELINHARNKTEAGVAGEESKSISDVINILMIDLDQVKKCLIRNFEGIEFDLFDPTSIFYYLEYEDEIKNPSWKRRKHRFCPGVDVQQVNDLNDALKLAELSYANSIEEIRNGLEHGMIGGEQYELIYCQMDSFPGKPSHYLAVKRGQSIWSKSLEILMVIRGTKSISDMLTDALLDATDYRGGKAHDGIQQSGKYLVERHSNLMESLLHLSKKKQIKLSIIGHSLGAGAGTIAGMEFHDNPKYNVSVVGFGCPALLSKELSDSTSSYVTTVIGDADIVPRMSAATLGNVLLNILEYDWSSKARRDINQALNELILNKTKFLFSNDTIESISHMIDEKIQDNFHARIKERTTKRMETILYPPGKCIHFYRDGVGVSGAVTPVTFFNEIDISRTMLDDHVIKGYRRIFLDVMRDYHDDDHFSFEARNKSTSSTSKASS